MLKLDQQSLELLDVVGANKIFEIWPAYEQAMFCKQVGEGQQRLSIVIVPN